MGQNVAEEYREAVRDGVVAGDVKVGQLREAPWVLAYARNVIIASRISEACPACT